MSETKAAIHLEFDENGRPVIRRLEGDLPETTKMHLQKILGWVDNKDKDQEGTDVVGDDPGQRVFQGSPPYLKQDAGLAGKQELPNSPPRLIPAQMDGHPGVIQGKVDDPISFSDAESFRNMDHVADPGMALTPQQDLSGLAPPPAPLRAVISAEDLGRFHDLKSQIERAAAARDFESLDKLKQDFSLLKKEFEDKLSGIPPLNDQKFMAEVVSDSPNAGGKVEAANIAGVPLEDESSEDMGDEQNALSPLLENKLEQNSEVLDSPGGTVGDVLKMGPKAELKLKENNEEPINILEFLSDLENKAPKNEEKDNYPWDQFDPETARTIYGRFLSLLGQSEPEEGIGKGFKHSVFDKHLPLEVFFLKSFKGKGDPLIGVAKDFPKWHLALGPSGGTEERGKKGEQKKIEKKPVGFMHRPAFAPPNWRAKGEKSPGHWMQWSQSPTHFAAYQQSAQQAGQSLPPWGRPPRKMHKYIRRWWSHDHWEYEYAEDLNKRNHGLGKNAMEAAAHAWDIYGRSNGKHYHDSTIEIPDDIYKRHENAKLADIPDPFSMYKESVAYHNPGMMNKQGYSGLDPTTGEPLRHHLTWVEKTPDDRYHVFRQRPDFTREIFHRVFNPIQLEKFLKENAEQYGLESDPDSIHSKEFRNLPNDVLFPKLDKLNLTDEQKENLEERYEDTEDEDEEGQGSTEGGKKKKKNINPYSERITNLRDHIYLHHPDRALKKPETDDESDALSEQLGYEHNIDFDTQKREKPIYIRDRNGRAIMVLAHHPDIHWQDVDFYKRREKSDRSLFELAEISDKDFNKLPEETQEFIRKLQYAQKITASQYKKLPDAFKEPFDKVHYLSKKDYYIHFLNDDPDKTNLEDFSDKYRQFYDPAKPGEAENYLAVSNTKERDKAARYIYARNFITEHGKQHVYTSNGKPVKGKIAAPFQHIINPFIPVLNEDGTIKNERYSKYPEGSILYKIEMGQIPYRYVPPIDKKDLPDKEAIENWIKGKPLPDGYDDYHFEPAEQLKPVLTDAEQKQFLNEILSNPKIRDAIQHAVNRVAEHPRVVELMKTNKNETIKDLLTETILAIPNMLVVQRNPSHPRTYAMGYIPGHGALKNYIHEALFSGRHFQSGWLIRHLFSKADWTDKDLAKIKTLATEALKGEGGTFDIADSGSTAEEQYAVAEELQRAAEEATAELDKKGGERPDQSAFYPGAVPGKLKVSDDSQVEAAQQVGKPLLSFADAQIKWTKKNEETPEGIRAVQQRAIEMLDDKAHTNLGLSPVERDVSYLLDRMMMYGPPDEYWQQLDEWKKPTRDTYIKVVNDYVDKVVDFDVPDISPEGKKYTEEDRQRVKKEKALKYSDHLTNLWLRENANIGSNLVDGILKMGTKAGVKNVVPIPPFAEAQREKSLKWSRLNSQEELLEKSIVEYIEEASHYPNGKRLLLDDPVYQKTINDLFDVRRENALKCHVPLIAGDNIIKGDFLSEAIDVLHRKEDIGGLITLLQEGISKSVGSENVTPNLVKSLAHEWYQELITNEDVKKSIQWLDYLYDVMMGKV